MKTKRFLPKKRSTLEDDCQRAIVKVLRRYEGLGFLTYCHVPNQLGRTATLRKIFAALGLRAGVSDLLIFLKGGRTLFVELKIKNNYQHEAQKTWQNRVEGLGYDYHLLTMTDPQDGVRQVHKLLEGYGV